MIGFPSTRTETIEQAFDVLREATRPSPSPIANRLSAAANWRWYSKKYNHKSQLEAMEETLNVLNESMALSRSLKNLRHRASEFEEKRTATVGSEAAALAFNLGDIKRGVALLERGRGLIFTQLGRFRRDLRDAPADLVHHFSELSATLDDLVVHGAKAKAMQGCRRDIP